MVVGENDFRQARQRKLGNGGSVTSLSGGSGFAVRSLAPDGGVGCSGRAPHSLGARPGVRCNSPGDPVFPTLINLRWRATTCAATVTARLTRVASTPVIRGS